MKAAHLIRNSLLTGVCIGLLTGCSWLDDWPPANSEMAARIAPKPPESRMDETSNAGWPEAGQTARAEPKGLSIDAAAADRIAALEQEISGIRNQLDMMMPALTKLAEAQGDIQKLLNQVEPAAGGGAGSVGEQVQAYNERPTPIVQSPSYQPQSQPQQQYQAVQPAGGPPPGSVAWYEQQEQQSRQGLQGHQGRQPELPTQQAQHVIRSPVQNNYQPSQQQAQTVQPAYQPQPGYQPQAATYQPQPAAYQPPVQPASVQPASFGGHGATVTSVRVGDHTDKTRLVLDTSNQVAFRYDVDNRAMLMTISLPGTSWSGPTQMAVTNSPLVASYSAVSDGAGGQIVTMQLRQPVRLLWAQALPPGGEQGNRVVFDLAPL